MNVPNILKTISGEDIKKLSNWENFGRNEALSLLSENVFGYFPKAEIIGDSVETELINEKYIENTASLKRVNYTVKYKFGEFSFPIWLIKPKKAKNLKKIPTFIYIMLQGSQSEKYNIEETFDMPFLPLREITKRGFAVCVYRVCDLALDCAENIHNSKIHKFFNENGYKFQKNSFATIGAWSYGAMRCADYINNWEQDLDKERLMIIGHSRGGKTALWAGANDRRFKMVVSNDSGCGGAAIARGNTGEKISDITKNFPHWFCENYNNYSNKEEYLPFDMHYLLALCAPRLLCVGSALEDEWACPPNEFDSCKRASKIYNLYDLKGVTMVKEPIIEKHYKSGNISYHIRTGKHALTLFDWNLYMDFAKKLEKQCD